MLRNNSKINSNNVLDHVSIVIEDLEHLSLTQSNVHSIQFDDLPVDVKLIILTEAISAEVPQFFRDLTNLSAVSKEFYVLCQQIIKDEVIPHSPFRTNKYNDKKNFNEFFITHRQMLHHQYSAIKRKTKLEDIQKNIKERKAIMCKGVLSRNTAIVFSKATAGRSLVTYIVVMFISMSLWLVHLFHRSAVCKELREKSDEEFQDCLSPLRPTIEALFNVSHHASEYIMFSFVFTIFFSSPVGVALFERLIHLLVDGFKLILLQFQESKEISHLAEVNEKLYQYSTKFVAAIKWQEAISTNDGAVRQAINTIKQQDYYQIMHKISELGYQHRLSRGTTVFREQAILSLPNDVEEDEKGHFLRK